MQPMFTHAITRTPGRNFAAGLTTVTHATHSYASMLQQHAAYVQTLRGLGLNVVELEPLSAFPDGYFVEDAAIVTPEVAVITNPATASRNGEEQLIAPTLAAYRNLVPIQPPGTIEGGDVLIVGKHVLIGLSARTNQAGAAQLGGILAKYGYTWATVPVTAGLHLKSSVNYVGQGTLLLTAEFAAQPALQGYQHIIVNEEEAYACNTLYINEHLIMPAGYPQAKKQLERLGYPMIALDVSEVRAMDGGLTCLSLRF